MNTKATTMVVATGEIEDEVITKDIQMTHDVGAPDHALLATAMQALIRDGGLAVIESDILTFYPLSAFKKLELKANRVLLATSVVQ